MMTLLDSVSILLKFCEFPPRIVHPEFGVTCVPQGRQIRAAALRYARHDC